MHPRFSINLKPVELSSNVNLMSSPDFTLPSDVFDSSVWYGTEVARLTDWIVRLTDTEIAEVEAAAHKLKESY